MFSKIAKDLIKQRQAYYEKDSSELRREQSLEDIESGKFATDFADWVRDHAKNEKGMKVISSDWLHQWDSLNGDARINVVVISGAAQVYKSLGSYLLNVYTTEVGKLNGLYCFSKSKIRDKLVNSTLKPIRDYNREMMGSSDKIEMDNNQSFKTDSFTSYYSFINSNNMETSEVPAEIASISVDIIWLDEYQKMSTSIAATVRQRQANSRLESRAIRYISTPGRMGTGVDQMLQKATHIFEAHVNCPHCQKSASLNPLKALFKMAPTVDSNGSDVLSFFDAEMRMLDWHHKDENDKINTAYLACEHCGGELPTHVNQHAYLKDSVQGLSYEEFRLEVQANPWASRTIGLIASPFLRTVKRSIAVRIVDDAMATENPLDFVQQTLGIATNDIFNGITVAQLRVLVDAPKAPTNLDEYTKHTTLGMDVARSSHYYCVMDCYIPKQGTKETKYKDTIRSVRSFGRVPTQGISGLIAQEKPNSNAVDLNPDQTLSFALYRQFKFIPFVQQHALSDIYRENKDVEAGGANISTFSINNQYFLNQLINNFRRTIGDEPVVRLPLTLKQYLLNTTKSDPIGHIVNMTFNQDKEMWMKGDMNRSDYFYAMLFSELSLYHHIFSKQDLSWLTFYAK